MIYLGFRSLPGARAVPVTAKLSRRFYEAFGDETTNELVDWFNGVDAQYKSELRELADAYYGRFRAELKAEITGLRAELIKWMFLFWIGSVFTTAGLILAFAQALRR
jgi:hypothetical protein